MRRFYTEDVLGNRLEFLEPASPASPAGQPRRPAG